ncbi:MAG: GNAT family N-acetyltransferase [Halioglobus sp.]
MPDAFLTLQPLTNSHLALLERWLDCDHVKPWFPNKAEVLEHAQNPTEGAQQAIIYYRRIPVGYLRWQLVDNETLQSLGLSDVPAGSADADILIGEPSQLGQGIAPVALNVLCKRLGARAEVPLLALTSSVNNQEAHRAFDKAGFTILTRYTPEGFGECYLFTRALDAPPT